MVTQPGQQFIVKLASAILYAELRGNGGNLTTISNPTNETVLDSESLDSAAVKRNVCAAASSPPSDTMTPPILDVVGVSTALYAVKITVSDFEGSIVIVELCSIVNTNLLTAQGITSARIKNSVCGECSSNTTLTVSSTRTSTFSGSRLTPTSAAASSGTFTGSTSAACYTLPGPPSCTPAFTTATSGPAARYVVQ
ncbi:MAG: hypothetical protein M1827_000962 [Pycnora praestabilis]|nr:MAG: hypothetical protein M1827_000962 [Pycnora praestabilis]